MPHTLTHCRTAGQPKAEKKIMIYSGGVLDWATHLSPHEMIQYGVSEREMEEFEKFYGSRVAEIFAELERLGVPYAVHAPHKENFE
jgi:hypothetical protein